MENKTHDLDNKLLFPNHHVVIFTKENLLNIQSNVPIHLNDSVKVEGQTRTILKILTDEPTNPELNSGDYARLNGNIGVYSEFTRYYEVILDTPVSTPQKEYFKTKQN